MTDHNLQDLDSSTTADAGDEFHDLLTGDVGGDAFEDGDELLESNADLADKIDAALGTATACTFCRCTEDDACETDEGPCHWIQVGDRPVCSNPDCVAKLNADTDRGLDQVGELATPPTPVEPATAVKDVLSAFTLKELPKRMRSQPLAAQSNAFITSAIGRIVAVIDGAEPLEHEDGAAIVSDLSALLAAADRRDMLDAISAETREVVKTFMDAYYASKAECGDAVAEAATEEATITVSRGDVGELATVPLTDIAPDPDQPRVDVDAELEESIKAQGILQPIVLRANPTGATPFMIVDGERRWRGAQAAGLQELQARIVSSVGDAGDLLLKQLTFNDGKRLTPIEEARAWKRILDAKGWTVAQLAHTIGKSRSTVGDRMAMLDAPAPFQKYFEDGTLSAAAAPILRPFADLPINVLEKMSERASLDYQWNQSVLKGEAVPLDTVKHALQGTLSYPFAPIEKGSEDYEGETFELKGQRYAVDRSEYYKHLDQKRRAADKALGVNSPRRNDHQKQYEEENRKRLAKQARDTALRRAQILAVNAKLPTELSASWLMLVIENVLSNTSAENVADLIGIDGSGNVDKKIEAYAKSLDAKGRSKLLLQILLAGASNLWAGVDFLKDAAALTRIDLKKVKVSDPDTKKAAPEKASPTARAKKPAAKKKAPAVNSRAKKSAKAKRGGKR
jgi:ParB family chromosome partitioning protein